MNPKSLFIIYTPYQLMSALNIIKQSSIGAVMLFVTPQMETYKNIMLPKNTKIRIVQRFYKKKTNYNNKVLERMLILFRLLLLKRAVRKVQILQDVYYDLYVPSDEPICRVVYHYLNARENERRILLHLFDDGIGTYSDFLMEEKSIISRICYKLLKLERLYEDISSIHCYYPELVKLPRVDIKIEKIDNTVEYKKIFNIPQEELTKFLGKKVIFLDQGASNKEISRVLNLLACSFQSEEVIIKLHPRINSVCANELYSRFEKSTYPIPMEALCSYLNLNNILLLSYASTANITPFLLCDYNPYSVILVNMTHNKDKRSIDALNVFLRINEVAQKIIVFMPKTYNEFETFINRTKGALESIRMR